MAKKKTSPWRRRTRIRTGKSGKYWRRTARISRPSTPDIEIRRAQRRYSETLAQPRHIEIRRAQMRSLQQPPPVPAWAKGISTTPPDWGDTAAGQGPQAPFDYGEYMRRIAAGPSAREKLIQRSLFMAEPYGFNLPEDILAQTMANLQPLLEHPNVPKWSDYAPGGGGGGGYYSSPTGGWGETAKRRGFGLVNWRIGI